MFKVQVITASTRPARLGGAVATWFIERARHHGKFEVEPIDLREINLPLFDEPRHPRFGQYEHDHTKRWSAIVRSADAYVFVTPEYNFSPPPSLTNALDFLSAEWAYKAAGFVSYGGVSGGTRSAQMTKITLSGLKVVPLFESVTIPWIGQHVEDGVFRTTDILDKSAVVMLDELLRWTEALKPLRDQSRSK